MKTYDSTMSRLWADVRPHSGTAMKIVLLLILALECSTLLTVEFSTKAAYVVVLALAATAAAAASLGIADAEKRTAAQFETEAQTYSELLDDHFLVIKMDTSGRIIWANPNFLKRTGYTIKDLDRTQMESLCAGAESKDYLSGVAATLKSGRSWSGEFCGKSKDGSNIWLRAILIPRRNNRGAIDSLMTIAIEMTVQRSAEEELKQANARLEAFIRNAPAAVAMLDTELRHIALTDRWRKAYSLGNRPLLGAHLYDVFPETSLRWRARHQHVLAGATETSTEERITRDDGSEQVLHLELRPWYRPDNSIGGMMILSEDISERKRLQDQLWMHAKLDPLTNLPNRLHFGELMQEALTEASSTATQLGIALIDLDRFKEINDTLGHDAGDHLLKTVGDRLKVLLHDRGVIARLGGDEFAVLIMDSHEDSTIASTVSAISAALTQPITINGLTRPCSGSIGVTIFPDDGTIPSDLLKNADLALYEAKNAGRDCAQFFKNDMRTAVARRVEMQNAALESLRGEDFVLMYQPIVSVHPEDPPSFEALLRWHHPELGLLSPVSFEDTLEEPKVAYAIGDRVMNLAISQAAAWQRTGIAFGRIAINITTADIGIGNLAARLREKLAAHGVDPSKICIEVTERVFLDGDAEHVGASLDRLHDLGVEIALDDFGTGYASLAHIKAFPINRLKVDRSFINDMQDDNDSLSIVQAIVQLGNSMGLKVTAEGVENREQLSLLRAMGCASIQGFYYAKPLSPVEAAAFSIAQEAKNAAHANGDQAYALAV